jgi:hypothetical protein
LIYGCSFPLLKNWGTIAPDNQTSKAFEKFLIIEDYNYYISGSDLYPTSILGLNKSYPPRDTDSYKSCEGKLGRGI